MEKYLEGSSEYLSYYEGRIGGERESKAEKESPLMKEDEEERGTKE